MSEEEKPRRYWRVIAQEFAREKDSLKSRALLEELTRAIHFIMCVAGLDDPETTQNQGEIHITSRPDIESSIQRIKRQISELESRQREVYRDAIYIDMTPEIQRECDARRRRIMELIEELIALRGELAA